MDLPKRLVPIMLEAAAVAVYGENKVGRALSYLGDHHDVAYALIALRLKGKFNFSWMETQRLISLGLVEQDEKGFYMSEVAEDFVDHYLQLVEEEDDETQDSVRS